VRVRGGVGQRKRGGKGPKEMKHSENRGNLLEVSPPQEENLSQERKKVGGGFTRIRNNGKSGKKLKTGQKPKQTPQEKLKGAIQGLKEIQDL